MEKRFGTKLRIVAKWLWRFILVLLVVFLFLIVLSVSIGERDNPKIPKFRAVSENSEGIPYRSDWVYTLEELEKEQEKFRSMGYSELLFEERITEVTKYVIPVADKKIPIFEKRSCSTVQYRAVMEDFFGERIYSNWVDDLSEIERREEYYLGKGYFNLPREERIYTETEYKVYFLRRACAFCNLSVDSLILQFCHL